MKGRGLILASGWHLRKSLCIPILFREPLIY
jgi:hypothetical protein